MSDGIVRLTEIMMIGSRLTVRGTPEEVGEQIDLYRRGGGLDADGRGCPLTDEFGEPVWVNLQHVLYMSRVMEAEGMR